MVEVEEEEEKEAAGKAGGGGERNTRDRQHSFVFSLARFGSLSFIVSKTIKYSKKSRTHSLRTVPRTHQTESPEVAISLLLSPSARERRKILSRPSGD